MNFLIINQETLITFSFFYKNVAFFSNVLHLIENIHVKFCRDSTDLPTSSALRPTSGHR